MCLYEHIVFTLLELALRSYSNRILEVEMTLTGLLVLLLIAGIVGALGQTISGYSFGGCLMSIIVGFVGAYVGIWLASQLGLPELFTITIEGESFPIVWGVIGSAILSLILGLFVY